MPTPPSDMSHHQPPPNCPTGNRIPGARRLNLSRTECGLRGTKPGVPRPEPSSGCAPEKGEPELLATLLINSSGLWCVSTGTDGMRRSGKTRRPGRLCGRTTVTGPRREIEQVARPAPPGFVVWRIVGTQGCTVLPALLPHAHPALPRSRGCPDGARGSSGRRLFHLGRCYDDAARGA
jgi:hypothetical protein